MRDGAPASVREWTRRTKEAFTQLAPHERRQLAQRYQVEDERGWFFIEVERAPVIQPRSLHIREDAHSLTILVGSTPLCVNRI